jgi:3-phenylpropionate/trans-cinnamate dioxygenase ferredoxin reductase subunit
MRKIMQYDVLIVGGGHGGAQAASALRTLKFAGSVAIVGEERSLPYERPVLSKDYLAGEKTFERILIRPQTYWADRQITMLTGRRVVKVDADARHVEMADGERVAYDNLIWATGGTPRRLSCTGHDLGGIHTIRTRDDVDKLSAELTTVERVAVIGGGYIGLEAAAVLRKLDKQVTLVETQGRVLARVAGEPLSRFYEGEHQAHGVDIRLNSALDAFEGKKGRVVGLRLADGSFIPADLVIVGIGIVPEVAPLLAAGATGHNGVMVDEYCRTSLKNIFAVGDCALHSNPFARGQAIRLESIQNANDQATIAAKVILGQDEAYGSVPWFWSNQYDLRLQTVGLSSGYDATVLRGDLSARSFSLIYLRRGRVIALDCVNSARDFIQGKDLVAKQAEADPRRLENISIPLNQVVVDA